MTQSSGSQSFSNRGTLNMRKNLAQHLFQNFYEKRPLEKEFYFTNCKQNLLIFAKRVVKVMTKKWLRNTDSNNQHYSKKEVNVIFNLSEHFN